MADDTIGLEYEFFPTDGMQWSNSLSNLPETAGAWTNGEETTICLCLSKLPLASGGTLDMMSALADGKLDVFVGNNTIVDDICLILVSCP